MINSKKGNIKYKNIRLKALTSLIFLGMLWNMAIAAPKKDLSQGPKGTTITGKVVLKGQPLTNAKIIFQALGVMLTTDRNGEFKISPVALGDYSLLVIHPKIYTQKVYIRVRKNFRIVIETRPIVYDLKMRAGIVRNGPLDPLSMDRQIADDILEIPQYMGVIPKYLDQQPGISSPYGLLQLPIVRGQNTYTTHFSIMGENLFYPMHFGALFTGFNERDSNDVRIYRGVIPISYSNVGGGVIDFTPKVVSKEGLEFFYRTYDLFLNGAGFNVKLGSMGTMSFSARMAPYYMLDAMNMNDYQGNLTFNINSKNQLQLTFWGMVDKWNMITSDQGWRNSNHLIMGQYKMFISSNMALKAKASFQTGYWKMSGDYVLKEIINDWNSDDAGSNEQTPGYLSEFQTKIKGQLFWYFEFMPQHILEVGTGYESYNFSTTISANSSFLDFVFLATPVVDPSTLLTTKKETQKVDGYIRYIAKLKSFGWDLGVRGAYYSLVEEVKVEPATMLFWYPDSQTKVYAGFGMYYQSWQPRWYVDVNDAKALDLGQQMKAELGVKTNKFIAIPWNLVFFFEDWKNQPLIASTDPTYILGSTDKTIFLATQNGRSLGGEISFNLKGKKWRSEISYSYIYSTIDDEDNPLVRSHTVKVIVNYTWNHLWTSTFMVNAATNFPNTTTGSVFGDSSSWVAANPSIVTSIRLKRNIKIGRGGYIYLDLNYLHSLLYASEFPRRWDFVPSNTLERAIFGKEIYGQRMISEMPPMIGVGLEVKF